MSFISRKPAILGMVLLGASFLLILASSLIYFQGNTGKPGHRVNYPLTKQLRYGFTVENPTNRAVHNAVLWAYAPVNRTATQNCTEIKASREFKLLSDHLGHQILRFRFPVLPPFGTRQVSIRAELAMAEEPQPVSGSKPADWLAPGPYVQSFSGPIESRASQLRGPTGKGTATNICAWVEREIDYSGYTPRERGALQALEQGKGDCTEFADLYAALARACDLPTRVVAGFVLDGSGVLSRSMYHNWAESYFGDRWRLADPQKKVLDNGTAKYVAFSLLGGADRPIPRGRLFKIQGKGLEIRMK